MVKTTRKAPLDRRFCAGAMTLAIAGMLMSLCAIVGCGEKTDSPSSTLDAGGSRTSTDRNDDPWAVFDQGIPGDSGASDPANRNSSGKWTIALATFSAEGHAQTAQQMRDEFVQLSGLSGAEVTTMSDRSILHYGAYESPDDARLDADIKKIRAITLDGRQPFGRAFPTIVDPSETGNLPQFELTRLWQTFPNATAIFSLQIGFYSFDDDRSKPEAREAAEELVSRLRSEGEPAFYYHGPRMSVVTVGIFFDHDVDSVLGYSPQVQEYQQKYPYNLDNGRQIIQTQNLPSGRRIRQVQESFLIRVPRN